MSHAVLQVHPNGASIMVPTDIPRKHKFAARPLDRGARLKMYGITVAEVIQPVAAGERLTPQNIRHATDPPILGQPAAAGQ